MSGTGKSSVLRELRRRELATVDTDDPGWCVWGALPGETDAGWLWNEDRMRELLDRPRAAPLVVCGCVANQGRFYSQFDQVVLLSAPAEVILHRLQTRTNNPYGKSDAEQAEVLGHIQTVEPLLRAGADVELDSGTLSIAELADRLARLARGPR